MDQFFFLEMSFLILYLLNNSKLKNQIFMKNLFNLKKGKFKNLFLKKTSKKILKKIK